MLNNMPKMKKNTPVHVEVMSILTGIIDIIIAIIVFT